MTALEAEAAWGDNAALCRLGGYHRDLVPVLAGVCA